MGYTLNIDAVTDFTTKLSGAASAENIWSASKDFFAQFGVDGLVYLDADDAHFTLYSTLPDSWHQHYVESNYQNIDSFAEICCSGTGLVRTGEANLDLYPHLSKAQKTLVQEAGETGYKAGFSSCFRQLSEKGFGGWNMMNSAGKTASNEVMKEHGAMLHMASFCAHQALASAPEPNSATLLSAREIECLQWLSSGLRTQQIAHKMHLKPVTIDFHLRKARQKLGVNTREHALAKALVLGLIAL